MDRQIVSQGPDVTYQGVLTSTLSRANGARCGATRATSAVRECTRSRANTYPRVVGAATEHDGDQLIPLPRPWLDEEELRQLNEWFYGARPDEYFETRLHLLVVEAARPELRRDAVSEGLEWRGVRFQSSREPERDDALHKAFVYSEATNLLHHIGETLLRLYLAHAPNGNGRSPVCPWIEIASHRRPGDFKRRIGQRFDGGPLTEERRDALAFVFYLSRESIGVENAVDVEESIEEIDDWLTYVARRFLDEAPLFNSFKHGLAFQATDAALEVQADDQHVFSQAGPSLRFLETKPGPEGLWRAQTLWVRPDALIAETWFAIMLLRQVMIVGRARYLRDFPERLQVVKRGALSELHDAARKADSGILRRLSFGPNYTFPYEIPLRCSDCGRLPTRREKIFRTWKARHRPDELVRPLCPECVGRVAG